MAEAAACRQGRSKRDPLVRVLSVARWRHGSAGRTAGDAAGVARASGCRYRLARTLPLPGPGAVAGATTGAAGPASSFGHSLLRLNTEDGSASDGLVDLGVNFGALVPDGESTLVYVVKGLSGGYQ